MTELYKWWNGFRDANTGEILLVPEPTKGYLRTVCGLPDGLLKAELSCIQPKNEKQAHVMNSMWKMCNDPESPTTMIVSGGNGTGKSYLGAALVHTLSIISLCSNCIDWDPYYTDEAMLLMKISSFGSEAFFRKVARDCRLLVIDEFAMTQWTPTDKKKMEQILNVRYGNNLATVLLTNRTPSELYGVTGGPEGILSSQIRSRFAPGYNIELTGVDLRRFDPDDPF